jgi:hypothetical protein
MLQVYREEMKIVVVGERDNLSVGRLRLFVQMSLPNWKDTSAASFVWNDPTQWESSAAVPESRLRGTCEAMGVNIETLLDRASAWWRERDERLRQEMGR